MAYIEKVQIRTFTKERLKTTNKTVQKQNHIK